VSDTTKAKYFYCSQVQKNCARRAGTKNEIKINIPQQKFYQGNTNSIKTKEAGKT
jgi:hypothetical protein